MAKIINDKLPENPNLSTINQSLELYLCELICVHVTI